MPEAHNSPMIPIPETAGSETAPTVLAASLWGGRELISVGGALTPRIFDAPEREKAALVGGAAVYDLGFLRRVAVRGEDRFRWLSGMVTNTVSELPADGLAWNLLLNAQGRILGDLHTWREGEELSMVAAVDQQERILAHLDKFIIMDDVELAEQEESAIGLAGPGAEAVLARLGVAGPREPMTHVRAAWGGQEIRIARMHGTITPRFELWTSLGAAGQLWAALAGAGAEAVGADTLEALRIAEGTPLYGVDMAERDLPQETNQLRALHFSKGCYLGQEIVERIRSRGNVHRHLRQLELDGPVAGAGTELLYTKADGREAAAGNITSAAAFVLPTGERRFALGMIRGEAELRPQDLHYTTADGTGRARILNAPPTVESR